MQNNIFVDFVLWINLLILLFFTLKKSFICENFAQSKKFIVFLMWNIIVRDTPSQMNVDWLRRNIIEIQKLMYIRKILWTIPISSRNKFKENKNKS